MADTKTSELPTADAPDGTELILLSQGGADAQTDLDTLKSDLYWQRPSDWPAMPATAANTMHLLFAVFPNALNNAAIRMSTSTGTWNVDWGDGTTTSGQASNTTAEHTYDFNDADLPSATSRGFKVAVVTITANTGNFTTFNPNIAGTGLQQNGPNQWLEMQINGSALTTLFANVTRSIYCEHVNIVAVGTVTNLFLGNMPRLQKLEFVSTLFNSVTSWANMFLSNALMPNVDLSGMSASITDMSSAFSGCVTITELVFPSGTLGAGLLNIASMCAGMTKLRSITFPSGAFSAVTNASNAFQNTTSLLALSFPSGAFASVTNTSNMLGNCGAQSVEFPNALTAVTNVTGMLGSLQLGHVKFASGGFASVVTAIGTIAGNPGGLCRCENMSLPISFSLANQKLNAAALDEIYTALPTITSQTITVTGNPGTSGDDPTIATAKGWTVSG